MSERPSESAVERLRKQAERAIAAAQDRKVVEPLLERLVAVAPEGSDASLFAHRHLAEHRLEDHPWRALLHLRKVVLVQQDDDVVHALIGLSHALLANFRSAVGAYRKAIALAPKNPWYHHNLGHLLDVALGQPQAALRHLEFANRSADPPEHEISASYAHCLARVGKLAEARAMAEVALRAEPRNREHSQLLAWIARGAPEDEGEPKARRGGGMERIFERGDRKGSAADGESSPPPQARRREPNRREASESRAGSPRGAAAMRGASPARGGEARVDDVPAEMIREARADRRRTDVGARAEQGGARARDGVEAADDVSAILDRAMREGGFTPEHVARARRLWTDYKREREEERTGRRTLSGRRTNARAPKPDVCAAAIEYAIARLHGLDGVTRASVARRYGVSAKSVGERFDDIQVVLALKPEDPRYAFSPRG